MRKFRITGIDGDSGFETSVVIEAKDANLAEMEAIRRGIAVRSCEVVIEPNDAATRLNQAMEQYRVGMNQAPPSPDFLQPPPQPPGEWRTSPPPIPAFTMPPPMYWKKLKDTIASGVFWGLMTWLLFWIIVPVVVVIMIFLGSQV